ncbi:kinase-like domain-containing protein [Radiomyces spectabilis]|uniref:kinase-like domain-containing protein n=1 Tax=Radiomyces spectabilis TaxID=64574 RepID=UPI00221F2FAD|nr:kinase-like domain-containing protein [Radiomyces spectabilis]KAI8391607.1 kinase-like domain-containing protein [Radiomyces spectabilis]
MATDDEHYTVVINGTRETFTINKRYKVIRKVGSGSYGTVCSALRLGSDEVVAIKKCSRIFDKKLLTKRCLREIKLLQHFNGHPRIIGLKELDIVDYSRFNEIYLIQQCCDTTLADIIHSKLELEPVHYQWFMYQIFTALKYIHSANVLHRDLKPANILVNQDCSLRICDFGMARGFAGASARLDAQQHMTHYVVTRWYRAPEIMLSRNSYDKAIDIWSVGCIFAELLGRKVLFRGEDYVDQLHKIIGILGLPKDTSFWDKRASESVVDYIKNLTDANGERPPTEPIDFAAQFPQCPPEGIDLLRRLLHLDPDQRLTVEEALEHPYVAVVRDPAEELRCETPFDFESFELLNDTDVLRQCIINEVQRFKGEHARQSSLRLNSVDMLTPKRRYTGSSISTPTSVTATEAHHQAIALDQQHRDVNMCEPEEPAESGMLFESDQFVGEPEDMDDEELKMLGSDEYIRMDHRRKLVGPSGTDKQALERHLSHDW